MTHIFISYSSKNKSERDELYNFLTTNDHHPFDADEIWFDKKDTHPGDDWSDSIDLALDDAFVLLLIVTPDAMQSHYVTYEWSWALGRGFPILPVVFTEMPEMHLRLTRDLEYFDWRSGDHIRLLEAIKYHQRESPLVRYINWSISNQLTFTQIFGYFMLWCFEYVETGIVPQTEYVGIIKIAFDAMPGTFNVKLPQFWLQHSHAFTVKQRRMFEKLVNQLNAYWLDFYYLGTRVKISPTLAISSPEPLSREIVEKARQYWFENLDPLFRYFTPPGGTTYTDFRTGLNMVSPDNLQTISLVEEGVLVLMKKTLDEQLSPEAGGVLRSTIKSIKDFYEAQAE